MEDNLVGLKKMRETFLDNQIGKLPKPTKNQTAEVKADYKKGIRCKICGGWHHKDVVHLDYIGHAALTDRLLDADPMWTWEPFAIGEDGLPAFDPSGGLWIKLTVCGHTRLGYGHATSSEYKDIGSREKEVIGDALRNAAMRFGAGLDLWHKGDLHADDNGEHDKKEDALENALESLEAKDSTRQKPQDAPQAPEEDVPELTPGQVITDLKKRLGAKMKDMGGDEKTAFYKWMIAGKKENVDTLQGFIDNYDQLAIGYETSGPGLGGYDE